MIFQNTQDNEMIKENSLIPQTFSLSYAALSINFGLDDEVIFSIAVLHHLKGLDPF
jgi:hypothetical protein